MLRHACGYPLNCLPPLVRGKLLRPPEARASRLGALPALTGLGPDQGALELVEPAQDGEHELAVRPRGERPEAGARLLDGREHVKEISGGARQLILA
jgi:hypothetical protein